MKEIYLSVEPSLSLHMVHEGHANALFHLIDEDREGLGQWLPWVEKMQSVEEQQRYIDYYRIRYLSEGALTCSILWKEKIAGVISMNSIDQLRRSASIGYWLGKNFRGKGLMQKSCKAMIDYCFNEMKLHRVQIFCGKENYASQKIPKDLGFRLEGCIREGEWLNNRYIDLLVYSKTTDKSHGII